MKKITIALAAIAAAFTMASCNKEHIIEAEESNIKENCSITASTESTLTKTALCGDDISGYEVVWSAGDSIAVGSNTFILTDGENTTSGTFEGIAPADGTYTVYYPSAYDGSAWPVSQTYTADNISGTPMKASVTVSGGAVSESINFRNEGGILRLKVKNDGGVCVKSITVHAAELTSPITLDCGTGGALLSSVGVDFHIAMPSMTYSDVGIELVAKDGKVCTKMLKSSTGGLVIERSKITPASFNTVFATDLSAEATANTYIVSCPGLYKFKATVKGNGGLDPLTGTTATTINPADIAGVKVLWEVYAQGRAIKHNGTSYDIRYDGGYIYFNTPDTFVEGDACAAIYDSENNILWSWLIWATDDPGTLIYNEKTFMGRNLGGFDTGNQMRGFLYQWGRKDAFSAADGGYKTYTYVPGFDTVFSNVESVQSISWSIQNPTTRVLSPPDSWLQADEYNSKPWRDDVKTIYDPCPSGWRVPSRTEMDGISGLPDTGFSGGAGFGNPSRGYYWTTTISSDSNHPDYAWAYCNDGRNMQNWPQGEIYAIRPVRE